MTTGTNVPPLQWTATGVVVPTQAAVLAGVVADLNAAFGGNLNPALNTPQGQLASSLAAVISQCYGAVANLVGNVNPAAAYSFMQDAIGYIYFLMRNPGTPTTVQCVCSGQSGTPIALGAQAKDTSGNYYECTQAGQIGSGGTVTLPFANVNDGPIACAANTVTTIVQAVSGWNSINNPSAGVPGTNVESQAAFAARIQASAAINASGFLASIYGALAALPGVTSVYVIQNDEDTSQDVGPTSYSLLANSLYVAVVGGSAAQIAQTIFTKKGPGASYNGNTSQTVYDTSYPVGMQPAYPVKFEIPNSIPVTFNVTLASSPPLPSNYESLIQNAIIALFQGGNASGTVAPVSIASTILAANYFAPVIAVYTGLPLLSITLGTAFDGTASVASDTTLTVTAVTSGFLAPGDIVTGTDIPNSPPTYIVEQLTGTPGGVGTYEMSADATATTTGITVTSAIGNLTTWTAGIDQIPTISAANVTINVE